MLKPLVAAAFPEWTTAMACTSCAFPEWSAADTRNTEAFPERNTDDMSVRVLFPEWFNRTLDDKVPFLRICAVHLSNGSAFPEWFPTDVRTGKLQGLFRSCALWDMPVKGWQMPVMGRAA